MVTISHINVSSAFRVSAVISALFGLIVSMLIVLPSLLLGQALSGVAVYSGGQVQTIGGSGGVGPVLLIMLCVVPFYAIIGGISGAISAWFYNLAVGWVGGLEVELRRANFRSDPLGIATGSPYDEG